MTVGEDNSETTAMELRDFCKARLADLDGS